MIQYQQVVEGVFLHRPNRFLAQVLIDGKEEMVHVKNTGRCKELLRRNCKVWLSKSDQMQRKTKYDLIAVEIQKADSKPKLVNVDSQIPNAAAVEWLQNSRLFSEKAVIKREVCYGSSRFDCYVEDGERKALIEVKGVTLERDGIALFPDAPTERGVKHVRELMQCLNDGYEAYILFVIQMKGVIAFRPNDETHRAFGQALREAQQAGVQVLAIDCVVTNDSLYLDAPVPIQWIACEDKNSY